IVIPFKCLVYTFDETYAKAVSLYSGNSAKV
ncbi:putative inner membrane protein oxaA, partial [Chlamydia psittaci C6/98]